MTKVGDPGHLHAHNLLREHVIAEAARFGLTPPTLAGPFTGGEPDHIGAHNALVNAIRDIANAGGIDLDANLAVIGAAMPDTAHLGDPGHVTDHDVLTAAVDLLRMSDAYNAATGGTVTDVDDYNGTGEKWRVHTITADETVNVSVCAQPFRVLLVGGGGSQGYNGGRGNGGGGGGAQVVDLNGNLLTVGAHPVVIGNGPPANSGNGGTTTAFGLTAIGGSAGGGGGDGGSGGWSGGGGGCNDNVQPPYGGTGNGGGNGGRGGQYDGGMGGGAGGTGGDVNGRPGPGLPSDITGAVRHYGAGGRGSSRGGPGQESDFGGGGGSGGHGWTTNGQPGVVIVAYRIG